MPISNRRVLSSSLFGLLLGFAILSLPAAAQTTAPNEWTWMGGSPNTKNCVENPWGCAEPGLYGTLGTPGAANFPGSRSGAVSWIDSSGNLWLFGGLGDDSTGIELFDLNDLWEYQPSLNEWTWMGGSNTVGCTVNQYQCGQSGVYGTLGVPAPGNIPGGRQGASGWTDSEGNLWLYGGSTLNYNVWQAYSFNDLWKFTPSTREWTWMGGSSTFPDLSGVSGLEIYGFSGYSFVIYSPPAVGTLGTPAAVNTPGGTDGTLTWTDHNGNLWLCFGNLWVFDPSMNEWALIGNCPVTSGATTWTDSSGNLWLYGGITGISVSGPSLASQLWEFVTYPTYSLAPTAWTKKGVSFTAYTLVWGTLGTPAPGNTPGPRAGAAGWTDKSGNLWLYGGSSLDANGNSISYNDMWEYSPSTNQWAWMGGSSPGAIAPNSSVYGTLGTPAANNTPAARYGANTWTDSSGNFWLFGGNSTYLNDLWVYQPVAPLLAAVSPTFSVATGTYTTAQTVTITDTTPGAIIYYTTNGVTPTPSSTAYSGPIIVSSTETLEAIAAASGYSASAVASAAYIINLPPPGFAITGSPVTVTAGATSGNTSAITLTPTGGFTGSVALTAAITSGPSGGIQPTLSFGSTTPASITGAATGTATLTITTTASSTTPCTAEIRMQQGIPWYGGGGAVLACTLLFGIPARRRRWLKMLGMSFLLIALAGGAMACGGGGGAGGKTCNPTTISGTTPGSYTITVTGASGSTTSTGIVNLTVQ